MMCRYSIRCTNDIKCVYKYLQISDIVLITNQVFVRAQDEIQPPSISFSQKSVQTIHTHQQGLKQVLIKTNVVRFKTKPRRQACSAVNTTWAYQSIHKSYV